MIGRMITPAAQMMLLCRPQFRFPRFQMTVNMYALLIAIKPLIAPVQVLQLFHFLHDV